MTYVGIDPSLTRTAVCILEDDGSVTMRSKETTGRAGASLQARWDRLVSIADWASEVVKFEAGEVDAWGIEGPSIGSKALTSAHDRSGLWWLMVDAVGDGFNGCGAPIIVPPTVRAKYATGKGNAGKDEVLAAVVRRYEHAPVDNNDEADAFVIAAICARMHGEPVELSLPATHLDALKKVTLP